MVSSDTFTLEGAALMGAEQGPFSLNWNLGPHNNMESDELKYWQTTLEQGVTSFWLEVERKPSVYNQAWV